MEKYFQGPKAKGAWMVNFSPWHSPIWDVSIWNCSFFVVSQLITPVDGSDSTPPPSLPRSSFAVGESCSTRWCLERSPVAIRRNRVLDWGFSVVVHLWWVHQSTPSFEKADILQDCGSTPRPLVLCCSDFKTFSNLEKCFTDSSIWGSAAESHVFFCLRLRSDFCFHPEVIPVLLSRCLETNDRVWSFNCKLHKLSHESRRNITSFLFQLCRCSSLVSLYFEGIHLKICLDAPSSSMKHVMSFWWSRLLSAGALRSKSFYILILTTSENGYWNIKLFSHWLGAKIIESFIILLVSWNEWPIAKSPL